MIFRFVSFVESFGYSCREELVGDSSEYFDDYGGGISNVFLGFREEKGAISRGGLWIGTF